MNKCNYLFKVVVVEVDIVIIEVIKMGIVVEFSWAVLIVVYYYLL